MELTQEQLRQLREKGLTDTKIQQLAKEKGYTLPIQPTLTSGQINQLKAKGLDDNKIATLAQQKGFALPEQPGMIQSFVQGAISAPARILATGVGALGSALDIGKSLYQKATGRDQEALATLQKSQELSNKFKTEGVDLGYFGNIKPLTNIKEAIGAGVETGSYLVGGGGATGAITSGLKGQVFRGALTGATTGAVGGGMMGFGSALQEAETQPADVAMKTLFGAATGGVLGGVLGGITPVVVKGTNFTKKFTDINQINTELNKLNQEVFKPTPSQLRNFGKHDPIQTYTDIFANKIPQVDKNNRFLQESVNDFASKVDDVYRPAAEGFNTILRNSPETLSLTEMKNEAIKGVKTSNLPLASENKAIAKIEDEWSAIIADARAKGKLLGEDRVPVAYGDNLKDRFWSQTRNFGTEEASISNAVNKNSGFAFKNGIENVISDLDVRAYNQKLGDLITLRDYLENLGGKQAGTGGKLTRLIAGRLVGTVAGSAGGIPGAIAGNITGDVLARLMIDPAMQPYRWLINSKLSKLPQAEILRLEQEANSVLQKMFQGRLESLKLPAGSYISLGPKTPGVSSVQSIPAQKTFPTQNPKTGKMQTTYLSSSQAPTQKPTTIVNKKAIPKSTTKSSPQSSLLTEAKKYKSAEEFVKAQPTAYHFTSPETKITKWTTNKSMGRIWFTDNPSVGENVGASGKGKMYTVRFDKNAKWATPEQSDKLMTDQLIQQGYDGVYHPDSSGTYGNYYEVFNPKVIKTKSQLTDIWKKANNK